MLGIVEAILAIDAVDFKGRNRSVKGPSSPLCVINIEGAIFRMVVEHKFVVCFAVC